MNPGRFALLIAILLFSSSPLRLPRSQKTSEVWMGVPTERPPRSQKTSEIVAFLPLVPIGQPILRLAALYYDSETTGEPDEAFRLWNVSLMPASLAGYGVSDGSRLSTFPALTLAPGAGLWCTGNALAFASAFGFAPECEYAVDSDPAVPNLSGPALRFGNSGGQLRLVNPTGLLVDALVYENGDASQPGWQGPAAEPYSPSSAFPAEGQILYRKLDRRSRQPLPDTDSRADWAQDPSDPHSGRRVQYPGWDLDQFDHPPILSTAGALMVGLAPDNAFDLVSQTIADARESIRLEGYSFEHVALANLLATRAAAGVSVTLLLEGSPSGGLTDQERFVAQRIEAAGGQVWFMTNDRGADDRYANQHAKFILVDDRLLLVSSENFTGDAMPDDDKSDGTQGRRGTVVVTDAPPLVAHALAVWAADFDPSHHRDLFRWTAGDSKYGAPPAGFAPVTISGGAGYTLVHGRPLRTHAEFAAQVVQAPEASLLPAPEGGIFGLVERAGAGDQVLVEQLYERLHWGSAADTPLTAPNPRLEAYLAAAQRGAQVRILLDGFFDDGDNAETVAYLNQLAQAQHVDLRAALGNPALKGLHNKMILVHAAGRGWVHAGSLNGSEASAKVNRELALQVQSDEAFDYLATAFWSDWQAAGELR